VLKIAELGGRAQYKVSRRCFSQRQVVDYARATCLYGKPALSACQLAEATASFVSKIYSACAGISKRKRLPTDKAPPNRQGSTLT